MKNFFTLLILASCGAVYAQEICDNAIDDDADGLIDLNDPDCDCIGFGADSVNVLPNPSFEERTCCPTTFSHTHCVNSWDKASDATSDYFNTCDAFDGYPGGIDPELPLPGDPGGEGFTGFIVWKDWVPDPGYYVEYVGSKMLLSPFEAGKTYALSFWTARGEGDLDLEISLFGTPDTADMRWTGFECPEGEGSWELLASQEITYATDGSWQEVSLVFTPTFDINAIAIGGPCDLGGGFESLSYYYLDELTMNESRSGTHITKSDASCLNNLVLNVITDTTEGDFQWYKDGIALVDETDMELAINTYGAGLYSIVHTLGGNCERIDKEVSDDLPEIMVETTITSEDIGSDGEVNLTVSGGTPPYSFDWDNDETGDFDDLEDLIDLEAGTYTCIVRDETGCEVEIVAVVGNLLGIDGVDKAELLVYPNPANQHIIIELQGQYHFYLTSVNGTLVGQGLGSGRTEVSLAGLAQGTYFLRLENEKNTEVIKVVKNL